MVEEQDLIAYLTSKGIQVYRAAGAEVTAHCLWCPDGDPKAKGKLYLNTESWLYSCKRCDAVGNRKTLLEHFGDEDGLRTVDDPMLRRRILTEAAELAHEMLLANESKVQYLLDRGISGELIMAQKIGFVPPNVGLSEMLPCRPNLKGYNDLIASGLVTLNGREFFNDCITIPYFSHGTVVQIRSKDIDGKYKTTAGDHTRLYNADALFGADHVLITEGEFDSLAVRSQIEQSSERALTSLSVVGLAGAGSWPDGLVESLAGASKVFIGLDPDDTGKKFAAKLKEALGTKGRIVSLPDGEPKTDWTDWFKPVTPKNPRGGQGWRDLRDLLVESDLAGKQMFTIADAAAKWSRRQSEAPGLKLGWPSLDARLRPGLKQGQVMIPLAATGTGKSVWLSNVIHNLRDQHVLHLTLEMTAAEVYEHLRRIHRFHFPQATRDEMMLDFERLQIVERNRLGRGDIDALVNEYYDTVGETPDLIVVDYLQYYARGFRGTSMYDRVSDAIMELKAIAKESDAGIIAPSQVNRAAERGKPLILDQARDAGTVEETGDFVISLFRPDQLVNRDTGERPFQSGAFNLQLLKSRHGNEGALCNLTFSNLSLAIVDKKFDHANASRIEQENSLYRQGVHYDDYRKQLDLAGQLPLMRVVP